MDFRFWSEGSRASRGTDSLSPLCPCSKWNDVFKEVDSSTFSARWSLCTCMFSARSYFSTKNYWVDWALFCPIGAAGLVELSPISHLRAALALLWPWSSPEMSQGPAPLPAPRSPGERLPRCASRSRWTEAKSTALPEYKAGGDGGEPQTDRRGDEPKMWALLWELRVAVRTVMTFSKCFYWA